MTKLTTRDSANRKSTSTRLTDTQLIVAQREDVAATLPDGMTEKAAQKLAATPVEEALVREIGAKPDMPVWTADTRLSRGERSTRYLGTGCTPIACCKQ